MKELSNIINELNAYRKGDIEQLSENVSANAQSIIQKISVIKNGFKNSIQDLDKNPTSYGLIIKNYNEDLKKKKSEIDFLLSINI